MSDQTEYLDHAAATPVDERVFAAMQPYFTELFYNPSATYLASRHVRKDFETARAHIAQVLGAKPLDITFTAGGTEANNLAIHGVMRQYPDANIVISAIEHDAVMEPARQYDCRIAPVSPDGIIDIEQLEQRIDDNTVLISVMYANNEVGTIQPIRRIAELVQKIRQKRSHDMPLYLHTDACQAAPYLDLHVSRLGIDMMTLNGGKMYGPKQSGILYAPSTLQLQPQLLGGHQERNRRSGTENVAFAVGFSLALDIAQSIRHDEVSRLSAIRDHCIAQLEQSIPDVVVNGSKKFRLPNNVHVTFPGIDNETLLMQLDEAGFQAAAGSACRASNDDPSHVLMAMGVSDEDAQGSIRFTFGRSTTRDTVDALIASLGTLLKT